MGMALALFFALFTPVFNADRLVGFYYIGDLELWIDLGF